MSKAVFARRRATGRMLAGLFLISLLLIPATADAARFGSRSLHRGMHGSDVKAMQRYLNMAGFRLKADGTFGRGTWRRVRLFERDMGLPANGVMSRSDLNELRDSVRRSYSGGVANVSFPDNSAANQPPVPGSKALLNGDGTASPPVDAPAAVARVVAAGNKIASLPYKWGGGHGHWTDSGYDCSGSVSYALHGGGLLRTSMASGGFESWGARGPGQWITLYANGGHIFMVVAGLRFDTSGANPSRWQSDMRSSRGYVVRHPIGY